MIELCCEYLSVWCIWLYVIIMPNTSVVNYIVWIHSETCTWHDNNIQSNAPYRWVITTQLNYLAGLAKLFSVCLQTKWLWVRISFFSLILHRHWKRIYECQIKKSIIFRYILPSMKQYKNSPAKFVLQYFKKKTCGSLHYLWYYIERQTLHGRKLILL